MAVIVEIWWWHLHRWSSFYDSLQQGLVSITRQQNENGFVTHCFRRSETLMSKTLGDDVREVFHKDVHMVNIIKTRPVISRLFEHISTNMEWHSTYPCTRLTTRTYHIFICNETISFWNRPQREFWNTVIQYLASICQNLNTMISCMQGKEENINTSTDKKKCLGESYRYG